MPIFLLYLLKTTVCSGLFFIYYFLALRNKPHHQFNRMFLLGSVLISLAIPFIHITLPSSQLTYNGQIVRLLNVVSSGNSFLHDDTPNSVNHISLSSILTTVYSSIAALFLFIVLYKLLILWRLYKTHPVEKRENVNLVFTQQKNTPYSFFNTIFWNTEIDLQSESGKGIFLHELIHVKEFHSADRLLMNIIVCVYWCNPFFWFIRKEMIQVHEFLADEKSLKGQHLSSFSQLILCTAYPGYDFASTSYFSSSSIKRRFIMLSHPHQSKSTLLSRWLALPLIVLLFTAFTFTSDTSSLAVKKAITVVIDAGHGGERAGAVAADGTREKDINLAIAQKVIGLNTNKDIKIILTRTSDVQIPLREIVSQAVKDQANAFISIHVSTGSQNPSGFEFIVSERNKNYAKESQLLGTLVSKEISSIYKVSSQLKKGNDDKGIWVLDAPEIKYPSLLIECGNLENEQDLAFLKNPENQDKIARQILKGIAEFANH